MTPLPLAQAAAVFFPHGGVTKNTLLADVKKGKLGFERIGNAYFTTEADIQDWRKLCREEARVRVSTCGKNTAGHLSTSSLMDRAKQAQNAALMMSKALTGSCKNTLPKDSGQQPGNVISLQSTAQRS